MIAKSKVDSVLIGNALANVCRKMFGTTSIPPPESYVLEQHRPRPSNVPLLRRLSMVVGILRLALKLILKSEPDKVDADLPIKHTIIQ